MVNLWIFNEVVTNEYSKTWPACCLEQWFPLQTARLFESSTTTRAKRRVLETPIRYVKDARNCSLKNTRAPLENALTLPTILTVWLSFLPEWYGDRRRARWVLLLRSAVAMWGIIGEKTSATNLPICFNLFGEMKTDFCIVSSEL